MDSILESIKQLLGVTPEYGAFDQEIMMHINSALMVLNQLGVGSDGFSISGPDATWEEFLGEDATILNGVRSYIYAKVKLMWDPPTSAAILEALNRTINEFEWRLNVQVENAHYPDDTGGD